MQSPITDWPDRPAFLAYRSGAPRPDSEDEPVVAVDGDSVASADAWLLQGDPVANRDLPEHDEMPPAGYEAPTFEQIRARIAAQGMRLSERTLRRYHGSAPWVTSTPASSIEVVLADPGAVLQHRATS